MEKKICATRKPLRHQVRRLSHVSTLGADCDMLVLGRKKKAVLAVRGEKTRVFHKE